MKLSFILIVKAAALSFLLDYEKIENDDDSDDSDTDDDLIESPQVALTKETINKYGFEDNCLKVLKLNHSSPFGSDNGIDMEWNVYSTVILSIPLQD
ncbi:hypothetical protein RJT34_26485 [Clitoria ternatea]|uniref:Cyclotide n=1 Tax=Clitoria ternatea TaxID=43366 RepID=A0AAN9FFM3_CLITE